MGRRSNDLLLLMILIPGPLAWYCIFLLKSFPIYLSVESMENPVDPSNVLSGKENSKGIALPAVDLLHLETNHTFLQVNDGPNLRNHAKLQLQPSPFPVLNELFVPILEDDKLASMYIAYPRNDTIILFSQGLREPDEKYCVQSSHRTKVVRHRNNRIHSDCCVFMFSCQRHKGWKVEEPITVSNRSSYRAPSTAVLHRDTLENAVDAKYFLCGVTMIKNCSKFLPDWVSYHRRIGVDHFYVLDNISPDLDMLTGQPDVEFIRWPWRRSQHAAFTFVGLMAKSRCRWIVYFDVDEYVYPRSSPSLATLVREHDQTGSTSMLRLPSVLMSSQDLHQCPQTSVVEGYLYQQDPQTVDPKQTSEKGKSVCRTEDMRGAHRVHYCQLRPGANQSFINISQVPIPNTGSLPSFPFL